MTPTPDIPPGPRCLNAIMYFIMLEKGIFFSRFTLPDKYGLETV